MKKSFGDYQTPIQLADDVLAIATGDKRFARILEPSCGIGNFIDSAMRGSRTPQHLIGVEVQHDHAVTAALRFQSDDKVTIVEADALRLAFDELPWNEAGPLLVVGNLPWVTNATLSREGTDNRPVRRNLKSLSGMDALTGSSNFDIAEYILISISEQLASSRPRVAVLCKTSVARNYLAHASAVSLPFQNASIRRIDARRWFGASVEACLFMYDVEAPGDYRIAVYSGLQAVVPSEFVSAKDGVLVSDVRRHEALRGLEGGSSIVWRQGIKHDAATVIELTDVGGELTNKLGERVSVEPDFVYPLLKGTDLFHGRSPTRRVILPQQYVGEDTDQLTELAPRLWQYLQEHSSYFDGRQSRIYAGRPRFSIFGIGSYSFMPYKVAISGFHKTPRFHVVGPHLGRPVMFDDTCYFVGFTDPKPAAVLGQILNSPSALEFIDTIAFWDAKRPITKKLLSRIDVVALADRMDSDAMIAAVRDHIAGFGIDPDFDEIQLGHIIESFSEGGAPQALDLFASRA